MSTLGAQQIERLLLSYPEHGRWRADCILSGGTVPLGQTTLTVGDLTLVGTVERADFDAPDKPHAVVAGGPGWELELAKPLGYQADVGLRLSTILKDLAALAGEPIEQPADRTIAPRFGSPASSQGRVIRVMDVLEALRRAGYLESWRVDPDGVTRFGARVGTTVTARATPLRRSQDVGLVVYGIDGPAAFLPGNIVDGVTIGRLVIHETSGKLEAEVWSSTSSSLRAEILKIVRAGFTEIAFGYPRTYVVAAVRADGRLDLEPPADAPELPELAAVEQWSLGGALVAPSAGAEVLVVFRDANPARPVVVGFAPGEVTNIALDVEDYTPVNSAAAIGRPVRYGDNVAFGPPGPGQVTWTPAGTMPTVSGVKAGA